MKRGLLLTTALVAVAFSTSAFAKVEDLNEKYTKGEIKGIYSEGDKEISLTTPNIILSEGEKGETVEARDGTKLILGDKNTDTITISSEESTAVFARGSKDKPATVNITGKTVNLTSNAKSEGEGVIWAQNNTTDETGETATVNVTADNINIKATNGANGIVAMS